MRHYRNSGLDCHLCGLPIPAWLVNPRHPLAHTHDHVVPRALGGCNRAHNVRPAHACCNHFRGTRDLGPELTEECRALSITQFSRMAIPSGRRWRTVRRLLKQFRRQGGLPDVLY